MNNIVKGALLFITGAASASLITYKIVKKKFEKIADEEIESVKATYERKLQETTDEKNEVTEETASEEENIVVNPYSSLVTDLGYSNKKEGKEDVDVDIEIIPPEDFGEYGYKCESLTYYADKVLTFDDDETIENVNSFVGPNALNTFGEYEDDSVFVRNHGMKTDFEILLDSRRYSDVVGDSVTDND